MLTKPYTTVTAVAEDTGELLTLTYAITEEQISLSEALQVVTFGIEVHLTRADGPRSVAAIPSLFPCEGEAVSFAECLARHRVTPATLADVAEDYMAEPVYRREMQASSA